MVDILNQVLAYEYVIYSSEDYQTLSGKFAQRINSAAKIGSEALNSARAAQINAMIANMRQNAPLAKGAIEVWEELAKGDALDIIMSGIASAMNQQIEKVWAQDFQFALKSAYNAADIFASESVEITRLKAFFDDIVKGISIMNGGVVPGEVFEALSGIGASFTGNAFNYSGSSVQGPITEEQARATEQVVKYLANAARKHGKEKGVSANSIRGTLNNIFGSTLGETLARQALSKAMPDIENEILQIGQKAVAGNPNIKILGVTTNSSGFQSTGSQQSSKGGTGKVDILNSEGLTLKVQVSGAVVNIDLSTNASVKWVSGSKKLGNISEISLGSRTFGSLLNGDSLGAAISNRGIAYNIIAHEGSGAANFDNLRKSLAASFFNEWLTGTGGQLIGSGKIDKTQLFVVNGKVYSMLDLVKESLDQGMLKDGGYRSINLSIPHVNNIWRGEASVPNWKNAYARSRATKEVINSLTLKMTIHLNQLGL